MIFIQAITTLVKSFPKLMSQWIGQILQPVWGIFTQSSDLYPSLVWVASVLISLGNTCCNTYSSSN